MKRTTDDIREKLSFQGCDNETVLEMCDEIERLQAIVDRLPKDASGRHVIAHEDELYHSKFPGGCGYYDGEQVAFYCGCGDYDYHLVSECWPTLEDAEKARGQ